MYLLFCLFGSPLQDDFVVVHIPGEYDSVLETVFKTEFLTLLSSKYQEAVNRHLKVDISHRFVLCFTRCVWAPGLFFLSTGKRSKGTLGGFKLLGRSSHKSFSLSAVEINDKDASKPVALHFNLPNHSQKHMAVCGLSLHLGNTEGRKNIEQKFIFQIGTLSPCGINERFSFL